MPRRAEKTIGTEACLVASLLPGMIAGKEGSIVKIATDRIGFFQFNQK